MSNRTKERQATQVENRLTKRERRELGRKAAAARARSRRIRLFMKNAGFVGAVVVVIAGIVVTTTLLNRPPAPVAAADNLAVKPELLKGDGAPPTTLKVTTRIEGTGPVTVKGQTLSVKYVGVLWTTGEQFDSNWDTGRPLTFELGAGGVIAGWDQGLIGVKVGSRVQLDIPQALAYPNPSNGQPAGALRFVVDIISATSPSASASPSPGASSSAPAS